MSSSTEQAPGQETPRTKPGMGWAASEAIERHQALVNRGELTALLSILEGAGPRRLLEIGTWAGGSAWAFSWVATLEHIVTVDPDPRPEATEVLAALPVRTTLIRSPSGQLGTGKFLLEAFEGHRPDVVFIDGDHTYEAARRDFDLYGALVAAGGLVVVHDTQGYPGNDAVQVPKLWAELRMTYRTTELIDTPGGPGGTGIVWC